MKVTRFDRESDLIIVKANGWGPGGMTPVSLALDTGSAHTVIAASIIGLSFLRQFNVEIGPNAARAAGARR